MNDTLKQLLVVRVADLMTSEVVTVSANSTMAEAAAILSKNKISGAPVVNEFEQCVGIISTADFVGGSESTDESNTLPTPAGEFLLARSDRAGVFHIAHVAEDLVKQHMSSATQTIDAEQTLIDAARYLRGEHIHHLVVIDEHAHPQGILTALDIVSEVVDFWENERRKAKSESPTAQN